MKHPHPPTPAVRGGGEETKSKRYKERGSESDKEKKEKERGEEEVR